ncbi:large ribosomal subunit protein uL23m isoform X1 [Chiloscyllium punctatum]|uniref:large ribosomal subunit protein uL23m isoform X1 n=1 Tax=Chiloscyllium punctatum TaxID=137246 RepID=UPI003B6364AC
MARRVIYPLYQLGNPQLRVFRTNFFMTLVRPGSEQPENTVQFRIPMEMTKLDVKNYLQSIYSVPVAAVRTRIQYCTNKKRNHKNQRVKRPDYKVAYVQLFKQKNTNGIPPDIPRTKHDVEHEWQDQHLYPFLTALRKVMVKPACRQICDHRNQLVSIPEMH